MTEFTGIFVLCSNAHVFSGGESSYFLSFISEHNDIEINDIEIKLFRCIMRLEYI